MKKTKKMSYREIVKAIRAKLAALVAVDHGYKIDNDQAQMKAQEWSGQAGGRMVPQLTENELAGLVIEAIAQAVSPLLKALDGMDRGCKEPGFKGHENGYGEPVGDELQATREELAALIGHVAAVEVDVPEIPWVETPMPAT